MAIHTSAGNDGIWLNGDPGTGYDNTSTGSPKGNPYMFTGRRLDPETRSAGFSGLYYYRHRMYNPKLARFMQTDPIGYRVYPELGRRNAMNLYQYAFNSPTNYLDPFGLSSKGSLRDGLTSEERLKRDIISFLGNAAGFLYHGIHIGLDVAGTFDPTPICDTIHTAGYLGEGRWGDAGLTAAGMIPYLGDAGKVGRYGDDALRVADKAIDLKRTINVTDKARDAGRFLDDATEFIGKNYEEVAPGVFKSSDGLRQVRFTNSDLAGRSAQQFGSPHGHFELYKPGSTTPYKNVHIPIKE